MVELSVPYHPPADTGLDLIYADDDLLVVNKPDGLLAVPGRSQDKTDCMATRVQHDFPEARVVHRLDMATSGLMIFARNADIHRKLSLLFSSRQISKTYIAIVSGQVAPDTGEINLPIARDWLNRPLQKIDYNEGKPSQTLYRTLSFDIAKQQTRLELEPLTGRTHQLRLHLASIGHPILGDTFYGGEIAPRLHLHAQSLSFDHPIKQKQLNLICEPLF